MKSKVLIVDDDEINVDVLEKLLRDDYVLATAQSGEGCLEKTDEFAPDVVLLDIMLPGMDGYETCRRLRAGGHGSTPQIVLVSAKASTQERLRGYEAGADDYVTKPFDHDELRAKVRVHARLGHALADLAVANASIAAHVANLEDVVQKRTGQLQTANDRLADLARELAEANVELARQARVDPLTRLLNRAAWQEIAQQEQERARRHDRPYSIAMIDVDHFKLFNDSQGHHAGDDCLSQVAGAITSASRVSEIVGRYGGEEFVVLAPETTSDGAVVLAERIRRAIAELDITHPASPTAGHVTVSIGFASGVDVPWEVLLKQADDALYQAKANGRNQVCAAHEPALM